ncbi:uncharacterized protein METZ01_LOCUS48553 [marine metagenome]|uniref:Endonuclease/exonuclease/phosphatase domain-containing protein n=1 Tax=marine metagenome TaxID=408172 RepID=A0A381RX73_9ZZZZ
MQRNMKNVSNTLLYIVIVFTLSATVNSQTYNIMSYNIRYDNDWDVQNSWQNRRHKVEQLLRYYAPAIFGLQEGLPNQVNFIDSCFSNYSYVGVGREDGIAKGEFCPLFFDTLKFTISDYATFWLSETPQSVSVGWDAALERICTYGLFEDKITKEKFWVFNTHFDHVGSLARKKSSELILKKIDEVNNTLYPVVLMGDLNSLPNSTPIQVLKFQLSDAQEISSTTLYGPVGTFNGFDKDLKIDKRIDYFFTSKMKTLSYAHIDDRLDDNKHISDHLPVLIKIKIISPTKNKVRQQ